TDEAIRYNPELEAFLAQRKEERSSIDDGYQQLSAILSKR
ncbi:MAG: hypothetical protein K2Q32_02410, partial [Alphaproteobacteria bacterium]|nr:hypothetical protein [Alphaproteobacteria bacterium]